MKENAEKIKGKIETVVVKIKREVRIGGPCPSKPGYQMVPWLFFIVMTWDKIIYLVHLGNIAKN